jgi:uncharacterized protein YqeY
MYSKMKDFKAEFRKIGIVPVVVLDDAKDAAPLAKALVEGGLPCAEVTFRTAAAADVIKNMVDEFPEILVGAGTVLTTEQVDRAVTKELRTAKEQLESCPAEREDLKQEYAFRVSVIEEFAPKMMSEEEIEAELKANYAEVIASGNKGQIMKTVMPAFKGKADGRVIQQVVAKLIG